jgi:hypothetical protein
MEGGGIKQRGGDERGQDAQQACYITIRECTTVVAALAAPQTPNATRNPNPIDQEDEEEREEKKP